MLVSPPFIAVETAMFFGLGFLLALLLMLAFMPAVHQRAVRLTRRKYAPVPLEQKEMHAEKDRLRADFAMSTRKLEHDIDHMQKKAAGQFVELARRAESIAQLKETLDTRDTLIAQLQQQNAQLAAAAKPVGSELLALEAEIAAKTAALAQANERIATLMLEVDRLTGTVNRQVREFGAQQHEIAALSKQSDLLRAQLEAIENSKAIEVRPTPAFIPAASPSPAFAAVPPRPFADRRIANDDGDVIRRALEAIEADSAGNGDAGWIPPSHGAVPFGH